MKLKNRAKILATTLLIVGILASSMMALASALPASTTSANALSTNAALPPEVEQLKAQIPATLADAEARMLPVRGRFVM